MGHASVPPAASVEAAVDAILPHIRVLPAEEVLILEGLGRVVAADVTSPVDLWPFPRAAMDGFAIRAEDVTQASPERPVILEVIDAALAGFPAVRAVTARTASRIATGAPIPAGADAVVPIEQVSVDGNMVVIDHPVPVGRHIFPAGEDARRGEVVVKAGSVLRAGSVGLLAALGITTVPVVRRAKVALLAVGDELVDASRPAGPGQVRDSNSAALAAAVLEAGGIPQPLGIVADRIPEIAAAVRRGCGADALVICAGMSVGERDLVKQALRQAGVELLFWRVPMKPGAPAAFGLRGTMPVFGLPGTPGAAMVAFEELVRPALRKMMGYHRLHRPRLEGRLGAPLTVRPGRRRYLWARAQVSDRGTVVRPLRGQGTATLRSISDANALLVVEPQVESLRRGDRVAVYLLGEPEADADADHTIPVLGVVGAKGAGKTALIERLLPELRRRGYRVAAVKHDVHGVELDREGTDTHRFAAAGADVAVLAGPCQVAAFHRASGGMPLQEIAGQLRNVDLILAEGYSQEPIPKVEVRRAGVTSDKPRPADPILTVVTEGTDVAGTFTLRDIAALVDVIEDRLLAGSR